MVNEAACGPLVIHEFPHSSIRSLTIKLGICFVWVKVGGCMFGPRNVTKPLIGLVGLAWLLIGCQARMAASQGAIMPASVNAQPTATTIKPVVVYTVAAPQQEQRSFALPTPRPPATATPLPPTAVPNTATPLPTSTASPTPMPTFTPPALPNTPPGEHYWLRRPIADGGVVWTDKTYPYGSTRGGSLRPHHGVDIAVPYNTEILAAASGTVVVAGNDLEIPYGQTTDFYGNLVVIELDTRLNGKPVYNLYGHLNQIWVQPGQHVDVREVVGLSGATGVADGPHLHFEVRVGANTYESTRNPLLWLNPFPDRGTVAGRVVWPDGVLVAEAPISLHRIDAPTAAYYATTTYANETLNPDDSWGENFALDDVEAGYYEATILVDGRKISQAFWVFPYRTNFVEFVLDSSPK